MRFIFLIGLVVLAGCTSVKDGNCYSDSDCVPKPGGHSKECVTLEQSSLYEEQEICTTIFNCRAAYNPSDCLCKDNKCINKNLENKCF